MRFARTTRRWLSGWLIGALLCMQWAMAVYACPQWQTPPSDGAAQVASNEAPAAAMAMPGCPDMAAMDMNQANVDTPWLCQDHCSPGAHAFEPAHAPAVSIDLGALQLLALLDWRPVARMPAGRIDAALAHPASAPPPGWPPTYLSLQVLRN